MVRLCAATLASLFAAAAIATDATEARIDRVIREMPPPVLVRGESPAVTSLAARMAQLRVPGVSIAVFREGRIEWARGFGVTRWDGPPVTERTLFQAASISKPVFALAVLRLADAGRVNLQSNVNEYLTSWKIPENEFTHAAPVTLRALLSHTAGVTAQGFRGYDSKAPLPTLTQILDGAPPANNIPIRVDTAPGLRYRYAGGGYVVAQAALQDVTHEPAQEYLQQSVLGPLGMKLSTFEQPLSAARAAEIATPYRADGAPVDGGPHVYPELAAAGLWTTPADLARYALGVQAALRGKPNALISASMARAMLTPVLGGHGLGPQIGGKGSRKFFTHNGGNEGYRCLLVAYEGGAGAVVMTNSDNGGTLMEEVMRSVAHVYRWPDFAPALRTLAALKPEKRARLIGVYRFDDGSDYIVREHAGRLEGNVPGQAPMALFTASDHELFARDVDLLLDFEGTDSVTTLRQRVGEIDRPAPRVDAGTSRRIFEWLNFTEKRFREQTADSRGEAAIRTLLAEVAAGQPNYRGMSPTLAESLSQQVPALRPWFEWLGPLKRLQFERVDANGRDEYRGEFVQGALRIFIRLNDAGRIESAEFAPG